jgi:hypothetical protein
MGAISNSSTWQCFKPGCGPSIDSLFFQSNLGIVTKLGIWLYPKQEGFTSCNIDMENESDLAPLVDKLGHLYRTENLQNHPVIGNTNPRFSSIWPSVRCVSGRRRHSRRYSGENPQTPRSRILER